MAKKQLPDAFKEFIQLLNSEKVEYLIVGGWAVSLYANPRATADIDFFVSIDKKNVDKIIQAYQKFGLSDVPREYFDKKGNVVRLGFSPTRIELLTGITGVNFNACYKHRKEVNVQGIKLKFISKNDLIKNKKAAGRVQDLADVEALQKPKRIKKSRKKNG